MNATEATQLLAYVKTLDQRFRVPDTREEREMMVNAWAGLLVDVSFDLGRYAVDRHYRSSGDTVTPNTILTHWRNEKTRRAIATGQMGDPGRKCTIPACSCTHTECFAGWLDEDVITYRNGRKYVAAARCPRCSAYLAENNREREAGRPW